MSAAFTSEILIDSVVRRSHIPINQSTFKEEDILAFANEEMLIGLVPSIMKVHEEFYVYPFAVPLVGSQSYYEIPDRAMGQKVRSLFFQDLGGNLQEMARILPEDIVYYQNRSSFNYPRAYYLENNFLAMVPIISDSTTGNLICKIFLRPNQLVTSTQIATVTAVNTTTGDVIVDQMPTVFTTTNQYDFIEFNHGHRTKGLNVTPISINVALKTITFNPASGFPPISNNIPINTNSVPFDLSVGDQVCLAGQTNIVQIPDELQPMLAQRVVCKCLEAQKDTEGLQNARQTLQEMELNLERLIDNRSEGNPQKVNNLRGTLRSGKFRRRRSTY